jgi:hypothetical protein
MKVKDLIEALKAMSPEAEVHFSYSYGDYWHTEVAPQVGRVEEGAVEYSDYHRMDKIVEDYEDQFDEETGEPKESVRRVVVLS